MTCPTDLHVDAEHDDAERHDVSGVEKRDVAGADDRVEAAVVERRRRRRRRGQVDRRRRRRRVVGGRRSAAERRRRRRRRRRRVDDVPAGQRHSADDHGVAPAADDDGARAAQRRQGVVAQRTDDGDQAFDGDRFQYETARQQLPYARTPSQRTLSGQVNGQDRARLNTHNPVRATRGICAEPIHTLSLPPTRNTDIHQLVYQAVGNYQNTPNLQS